MIRPALTEFGVFLIPFVIYAAFLLATRAGVLAPESWPMARVLPLTAIAFVFIIASLLLLSHFSGAPPGSTYEPAHIENGVLVPGRDIPGTK